MKKKIYILSSLFIIIDQISKFLITSNFEIFEQRVIVKDFFSLTFVTNTGGAFNILSGNVLFLVFIGCLALIAFDKYIIEDIEYSKPDILMYAMIIGGIIGNLIDRIRLGFVIDFLDFYIFGYDFAVFNLADVFIVSSVILIIIKLMFFDKVNKKVE